MYRVGTALLNHFQESEFKRPDLIDPVALLFLDQVRDSYGYPLDVTSDARTLQEELALPAHANPPDSSLHVAVPPKLARAFDLKWIADDTLRWKFMKAVFDQAAKTGQSVELEYEGPGEPHIHLGLYRDLRPSRLLFTFMKA